MWEHRNGILFDKDESILLEEEKRAIREQISLGFNNFPKTMRDLTKLSEKAILKMKPQERRTWLKHIRAAREIAKESPTAQAERTLLLLILRLTIF